MEKTRILVVEDEAIIAKNLQNQLEKQGYIVPSVVATGEEAVKKAGSEYIDLVLMDIVLLGEMDGIEAGGQIREKFDIPVIYLTAYADEKILERAKITEPFGYLIKPFEDRELHSTIQMALYKHRVERELKDNRKWLSTILNSIGDAVIATDIQGNIIFINPVAEKLTGWHEEHATGKNLEEVFNIINEDTGEKIENPAKKVLKEGITTGLSDHTLLVRKDGNKISISDSGSPITDDNGTVIGAVLVFHDTTQRKKIETELKKKVKDLEDFYEMAIGRELKMKELKAKLDKMNRMLVEERTKHQEG